jgi:hypothetical protein
MAEAKERCWFSTSGYSQDVKDFCTKNAEFGVQGAACAPCRGKKEGSFNGTYKNGAWCPTGMKDFGNEMPREPEVVHEFLGENLIHTRK